MATLNLNGGVGSLFGATAFYLIDTTRSSVSTGDHRWQDEVDYVDVTKATISMLPPGYSSAISYQFYTQASPTDWYLYYSNVFTGQGQLLYPVDFFPTDTPLTFEDGMYTFTYTVTAGGVDYSKTLYCAVFEEINARISAYNSNVSIPIPDITKARTFYQMNLLVDCATDAASMGNATNYTTIMTYLEELLTQNNL